MRALLCWFLLIFAAHAAAPLTLTVPKREVALRKGGTVLLDVELTNRAGNLLEGRLEVAVLRQGRKVSTHVSPELVVAPGKFKTQMLLPPPLDPGYGEGFAVRAIFVGKEGEIPLGDHDLGKYPVGGTEFVLAVARGARRLSDLDRQRERSARLESIRSALETSAWFMTGSLSVPVENLPVHPAGWCAYDLVFIDALTFADVSARQLEALARWIDAGGSALIIADGAMRERQVEFLQRIAPGAFAFDGEGRIAQPRNYRLSAGLGRVLLAADAPSSRAAIDAGSWRASVAWVWKVRSGLLDHIEEHGVLPIIRGEQEWNPYMGQNLDGWMHDYAASADRMAIEAPRPLPVGWVALLLTSLLLLAGPVDWYVLGWLRRRRLTWIVFPVLCVLGAWAASRMATRFLGPKSRETMIRFTDIGEGERVLRQIVLHLRVPASDEEWMSEVTDGLSAPMQPLGGFTAAENIERRGDLPETRAEWQSLTRVNLRQNLRQWTPNWRQSVQIGGTLPASPSWDGLIARWKTRNMNPSQNLGGAMDEFSIYFYSGPIHVHTSGQVLSADSPIGATVAYSLCHEKEPLPTVVEASSPSMTADMLGVTPRTPLIILAWRRVPNGLEVLRRHVTERELAQSSP